MNLNHSDIINLIGIILSVLGFIIVLYQFKSIKKVTSQNQKILNSQLNIANVANIKSLVLLIQSLIRTKRFEISLYKIQELNELLSFYIKDGIGIKISEQHLIDFKNYIFTFNIHISTLEKYINGKKQIIDSLSINSDLNELRNLLNQLDHDKFTIKREE